MRQKTILGLLVVLLVGLGLSAQAGPLYQQVVLQGSLVPLDWSSSNHSLTWSESHECWISDPIYLRGGRTLQFRYVYDGRRMSGANLRFTPPRDGHYQFYFHPSNERRIDVRLADEFTGRLTLRLSLPEAPPWLVPTVGASFNNFNYSVLSLKPLDNGVFELEIAGNPGEKIEYYYTLGGLRFREETDKPRTAVFDVNNPTYVDEVTKWQAVPIAESVTHRHNHEPFIPAPGESITIEVEVRHEHLVDSGGIYYTTDGAAPLGQRGKVAAGEFVPLELVSTKEQGGRYLSVFTGEIPGQPGMTPVKYLIDVWHSDAFGSQFADNNSQEPETATEFAFYIEDFTSPAWAKEAVIYHIFVDRFHDGNPSNNPPRQALSYDEQLKGWMGGDLAGIIEKLDYIAELGFNTLWLSPVFPGPYSHGYHATDFTAVDPRFGDKALLKKLITEAHQRNLRVIYDLVPNHTSDQHPFFQEAKNRGEISHYYDWYSFTDWPTHYATFYGISELPQLNYENYQARSYMIEEVVPFWLAELDFDGFRLDYAKGPSYSFWVDFRHAVKSLDRNKYIFGEIWDDMDTIKSYAGKFDGALDFGLQGALVDVFARGRSMLLVSDHVQKAYQVYPREYLMGNFLDNHDLPRFIFLADDDREAVKLAATVQYTLPGIPIVYYGTEVGLSQSRNHDEVSAWQDRYYREMMIWDQEEQDQELVSYYRKLNQIRAEHPVFALGEYRQVYVDSTIYAFTRSLDDCKYLVIVNSGNESTDFNVQQLLDSTLYITGVVELLTDKTIFSGDRQDLILTSKPNSVGIYEIVY